MSMLATRVPRGAAAELINGDRMSRAEFHRLYEQTPEDFKAELIGGIVHVAYPLKLAHGTSHPWMSAVLFAYQAATKGVELGDDATILLGDESEPQPDLFLRILPECGGLSGNSSGYVDGPVELAVEIAHSSRAFDLHDKRADYARCGIPEYLVHVLDERKLRWFDLKADREIQPPADRVFKLAQFPGLWIDEAALVAKDSAKLMAVLQQGLATPEHADFVRRLGSATPA